MFGKKKKQKPQIPFDPETQKAILRCSICTGEQVAGFQDIRTGTFQEVMLIKDSKDLDSFREMYGLTEIPKEY